MFIIPIKFSNFISNLRNHKVEGDIQVYLPSMKFDISEIYECADMLADR